jgi:hypothetical protein
MMSDINQEAHGNQDVDFLSTLPEETNNNKGTLSATAEEDDDDVTVQTSNSNSTKQAWMSFNIKLVLTSKQDTSDSALQHAMLTILATIDRELGADTKIFDGNRFQISTSDSISIQVSSQSQ